MADDGAPPPETAENEAPAEGEVADGGVGEAPPAEEAPARMLLPRSRRKTTIRPNCDSTAACPAAASCHTTASS